MTMLVSKVFTLYQIPLCSPWKGQSSDLMSRGNQTVNVHTHLCPPSSSLPDLLHPFNPSLLQLLYFLTNGTATAPFCTLVALQVVIPVVIEAVETTWPFESESVCENTTPPRVQHIQVFCGSIYVVLGWNGKNNATSTAVAVSTITVRDLKGTVAIEQ